MKYQWLWNKFYGGLAQDSVLGQDASFYDAKGVDIRTESRCVKAGQGVVSSLELSTLNASLTSATRITAMSNTFYGDVGDSIGLIAGTGGTIPYCFQVDYYLGTIANFTTPVNLSATSDGDNTVRGLESGIYLGVRYIYAFTKNRIHRFLADGTLNINHKTFTGGEVARSNPKNVNGKIYFHTKESFMSLDLTSEAVTTHLSFNKQNEEIVGFSVYNDLWKIYAKTPEGSWIYIWDGSSTAPSYTIGMNGVILSGVANNGPTDYVYSSNALYAVSGTQWKMLWKDFNTDGVEIPKRASFTYGGITKDTTVFIPGNFGLFTYGSYYSGFPESLNLAYQGSIDSFAISPNGEALLYGSGNRVRTARLTFRPTHYQGSDWSEPFPGTVFSPAPYIISPMYFGDDTVGASGTKSITEIELGVQLDEIAQGGATLGYITLFVRKQLNHTWQPVNISSLSDGTCTIYPDNIPFRDFTSIQFKVQFNTHTDMNPTNGKYAFTPRFYELKLKYEIINS